MTDFEQSLPPLATLIPFDAAFRHRSFTRAGAELHLSQASVSRRVRELEVDLGLQLFERNRHDVTPTTDAHVLAASIQLSLSELASTCNLLRRQAAGTSELTILSDPSLASVLVGPVLSDFQREYPDVTIRVLSSCEPVELTRDVFDLALQYGPPELPSYAVEFIAQEAVFPVCAPGPANQLPASPTTSDLTALPLLHVEYDNPNWTTWADVLGSDDVHADPESGLVFSSYQMSLDVAERGDGVALGWARSVTPRIAAGTLVRIPGITIHDAAAINAYLPRSRAENGQANEFLQLLRGLISND